MSSMLNALSAQLIAEYAPRVWDGSFHASQFYKCARLQQVHAQGNDGPIPEVGVLQTFADGHSKHDQLQKILKRAKVLNGDEDTLFMIEFQHGGGITKETAILCEKEGFFYIGFNSSEPTHDKAYSSHDEARMAIISYFQIRQAALKAIVISFISGSRDGVAHVMGYPEIFEIKTMRVDIFENLKEPLPEHVLQVHIYMMATGYTKTALILYSDKAFPRFKEYRIPYQPEIADYIQERARHYWKIKDQIPLTRQFIDCSNGRYKSWCWMKDRCKEEDRACPSIQSTFFAEIAQQA